jgi:hypothetical protein
MKKALLTLVTSFLITSSLLAQVPAYVPTDGLVGYWPFNGNANDESGNGNNGTVNGATLTTDRNGNANSAYSFDGVSSKINLSQPINFSNNSFTISLYCQASDFGNSQIEGYSYVFGSPLTEGTNDQGFRFASYSSLNTYSATIGDQSVNDYIIFGQQGLNFGWYNLTMVLDRQSSLFSFYINNNNIGSVPISENFGNTDSGLLPTIGTFQLDNWIQHYFNGKIDDIAIYNRALTASEITALYTGTNGNGGNGNNTSSATNTVPAGIRYQAVARNAQGTALANTAIQVKFTLITDSLSGTTEYVETHSLSTNSMGLFATAFGTGAAVSGTWAGINWTHANKYLKVELDAGNGFVDLGTQQLLSSPFAIRAQSAATIENGALPVYTNNAAAIAGGLTVGKLYRTATGDLKVVY